MSPTGEKKTVQRAETYVRIGLGSIDSSRYDAFTPAENCGFSSSDI